jgi:hypothetical protein
MIPLLGLYLYNPNLKNKKEKATTPNADEKSLPK